MEVWIRGQRGYEDIVDTTLQIILNLSVPEKELAKIRS